MGRIFLKDGRVIELTEEQTLKFAEMICFIPNYKKIKINNQVFTLDDIDIAAKKKSRLPQQVGIGINF